LARPIGGRLAFASPDAVEIGRQGVPAPGQAQVPRRGPAVLQIVNSVMQRGAVTGQRNDLGAGAAISGPGVDPAQPLSRRGRVRKDFVARAFAGAGGYVEGVLITPIGAGEDIGRTAVAVAPGALERPARFVVAVVRPEKHLVPEIK